jgi:hypothetical protein
MSYTSAEHATCFYYKYEQVCVSHYVQEIFVTLTLPLCEEFMKKHTTFLGKKKYPHLHIANICQFTIITIDKYYVFKPLFSFTILSKR